jgi:methyl halide transferase
MISNRQDHWSEHFRLGLTGWDIGYVSPPIKNYLDQLANKQLRILIPGAGKGWEVAYAHHAGFGQVCYLDSAVDASRHFKTICPLFDEKKVFIEDFFKHQGCYDLLVEQTFFSSLPPEMRMAYAEHTAKLLHPGAKVIGLLFNHHFAHAGPPHGGTSEEYEQLFAPFFKIKTCEIAYNSIKPRSGRELFIILERK